MRIELDSMLCERYPRIFQDRHGDIQQSCMARGFEIEDGWFDLIDALCGEIQRHVDSTGAPNVVTTQVKEKCGTLRFSYDGGDDYIGGLVHMAEELSSHLCRKCGSPDRGRRDSDYIPLCPAHRPEHLSAHPVDSPMASGKPLAFRLPTTVQNPGWKHLGLALEETLSFDIGRNQPPPVIEAISETEALICHRQGGNTHDRIAGMLRMVEAFSRRCDRLSGGIRPVPKN